MAFDTYRFQLCKASGELISDLDRAKARAVAFTRNATAQASVTLDIDDPLAALVVPGQSRLKVWASSITTRPIFYGTVPAQNVDDSAAAGETVLSFLDPRWPLGDDRYSLGTETYSQVDQGAILWDLIAQQNARAGGDTNIRQGATTTGTLRDRTYDTRTLLSQLFSEMAGVIDGPDFDLQPFDGFASPSTYGASVMGLLNVYAKQGSDLPSVKFVYGPGLASNCTDMHRTYAAIKTQATQTGTSAADGTALTSTFGSPASSPYGLLEDVSSAPDVSTQATLDSYTSGLVNASSQLRNVVTIGAPTPEAPQPFRDYYLGDIVRATCRKGSIQFSDFAVRIDGFAITVDAEGMPAITLTTSSG